jgi:hypothetical protein
MKPKPLSAYGGMIKAATTKEELEQIAYDALKNDPECTVFSAKYAKITKLCVKREAQLGLL